MGLGRHIIGDRGDLVDKGVSEEAAGNNRGVCSRETYIQICTGGDRIGGSSRLLR